MTDLLERDAAAVTPTPSACSCGSGLTSARCCALDLRRVEREPADGIHADRIGRMSQAYHDGDRTSARALAIAILEEAPGQREALGALYNVLKDAGELDAAGAIVDRLAHIHANDAVARAIAAQFFVNRDDKARAQVHARMLVRLAPLSPVSHVAMGRAFLAVNHAPAAEHHFRQALALGKDDPASIGHYNATETEAYLGIALREQGRLDDARAIFATLTEAHGPNLTVLLAWATLEESARDFAGAGALLDRAEALAPGGPRIAHARAGLHRRAREPERALAVLDAIDPRLREAAGDTAGLLQKGQILDSMGRYDEAFAAFDAFKRGLRDKGEAYRADEAGRLVAGLRDFFTDGRTRMLPRAAVRTDSPQPIFIIGFPRSGTTLVEQTLTSHPDIAAGDELPIIHTIVDRAQLLLGSPGGYPLALSELWLGDRTGHIDTLRDFYLNEAARIGALDPARRWFTDKMPLNETHLGLISLLFPQSPVIHLVRHPLDVVLSVFSNGLTHGFNCASGLDTAAQHYALIADLIAHYRGVMPVHYHAVRYEDLVTDQERVVREMLAFVGAPFDPATLAFHANPRPARTASHAQVTEPLYGRSRYRYRHYRRHLEPVIPILAPAIARLGYAVEG